MTAITEAEREFWWQRLTARVERLQRFVAMRAPYVAINLELSLVSRAVAGLDPGAYGAELGRRAQEDARRGCGLCTICGKLDAYEHALNICSACEKTMADEDAAADAAEAFDALDGKSGKEH